MHPAIFLDRDGVIIENRANYVRSWSDVYIYPEALEALARIRSSPFKVIIITNQSAIGRGLLPIQVAQEINQRLVEAVEKAGGRVDGVFMCPHVPGEYCDCRKPKPGLLLQAATALQLDLSKSLMVGDALSDVMAGQAAGVRCAALVRTGRGAAQALLPSPEGLKPFPTYNTLADVLADFIRV